METAKELIKQYIANKNEIKKIVNQKDRDIAKDNKLFDTQDRIYDKKIQKLRDAQFKLHQRKIKRNNTIQRTANEKIEKLDEHITRVNRIIYFLKTKQEIDRTEKTIVFEDPKAYHEDYLEKLGTLYKDDLLSLKLYINETEWRNKINRYSLIVIGKCLLGSTERWKNNTLVLPYGYHGLNINDMNTGANIKHFVTKRPTIEELKQYAKKYKDSILTGFMENYHKVKKEYEETTNNYKLSDFKTIIKEEA